jgi:hypothetical protein
MWNPSEKELEKLDEWLKTKDLNKYCGAIGGRFTYCITPTSLGNIYKVKDNLDKDEIDITEYDW